MGRHPLTFKNSVNMCSCSQKKREETLTTPESTHSTLEPPPSNNIDRPSGAGRLDSQPSCGPPRLAATEGQLAEGRCLQHAAPRSEVRAAPSKPHDETGEKAEAHASMAAAAAASSTCSLLIILVDVGRAGWAALARRLPASGKSMCEEGKRLETEQRCLAQATAEHTLALFFGFL